jgi:hypothetical protein
MRHSTNITGLLHPTHYTEDEKRLKRNKKAVQKAAQKRAATRKAVTPSP